MDLWYVPEGKPDTLTSPMPIALSMETFKDTSGIFKPKKLEEWRGGSSRISGISFVGTVRLGCVSPFVERMPVIHIGSLH